MPTTDITTSTQSGQLSLTFEDTEITAIYLEGNKPIFVASPIAKKLAYPDATHMLRHLDPDEKGLHIVETLGGPQEMAVITLPGLMHALNNRRPGAIKTPEVRAMVERFQRWVNHDVLPQILEHGSYVGKPATNNLAEQMIADPDFAIQTFTALKQERAARIEAEQRVKELAPKAEALDDFTNVDGSYSVKDAAALLSNRIGVMIGRNRLFTYMHGIGWIYRDPSTRTWVAYQAQIENGRLIMKAHAQHGTHSNGVTFPYPPTLRVTAKGLAELHKRLGGGNPPALPSTLGA